METGILWFDNDAELDLLTKVDRAAKHFLDKYGHKPAMCFVHPSMIDKKLFQARKTKARMEDIELRAWNRVLPDHFWITNNGKVVSTSSYSDPGAECYNVTLSF